MSNPAAQERARALFEFGTSACNCAAVDIGVGVMHEPRCAASGWPGPDEIATAIDQAVAEAMAAVRAQICPTCRGECLLCSACSKSRRDFEHVSTVHAYGPCRGAEMRACATCLGIGAIVVSAVPLPDDTLKWRTAQPVIAQLHRVLNRIYAAGLAGVLDLDDARITKVELRDALTASAHVLAFEP